MSGLGEVLHELGGVNRGPPLRLWHVGHILTKRDINSFGTLEYWLAKRWGEVENDSLEIWVIF